MAHAAANDAEQSVGPGLLSTLQLGLAQHIDFSSVFGVGTAHCYLADVIVVQHATEAQVHLPAQSCIVEDLPMLSVLCAGGLITPHKRDICQVYVSTSPPTNPCLGMQTNITA